MKKFFRSEYVIPVLVVIWSLVLAFIPFESQVIDIIIGAIIIVVLIINNILKLGKAKGFQLILGLILLILGIYGFFMDIALLRVSLIINNSMILLGFPLALAMTQSMGGSATTSSGTARRPSPEPEPEPSGGPEPM